MIIRLFWASFALVVLLSWATAAEPIALDAQKACVKQILATIDVQQPTTMDTAEEALVTLGAAYLPGIQAVTADTRSDLAIELSSTTRSLALVPLLNAQLDVLDRATIRLTWGINPPALIQQCWWVPLLPSIQEEMVGSTN